MSTFANGLYPDQNVEPNLNPIRLTPGWYSYKIFSRKKLVLKKNILVRLRKQNIRSYCFDESTIQLLDHCLATPKTGSYTRNRKHFPEYEICNILKTLHLNCLPSIYKIMQTKNANESVS